MELFLYLQSSGNYETLENEEKCLKLFSSRLMTIWSQAQETWSQQASSNK